MSLVTNVALSANAVAAIHRSFSSLPLSTQLNGGIGIGGADRYWFTSNDREQRVGSLREVI